jgi:hypothetical protein
VKLAKSVDGAVGRLTTAGQFFYIKPFFIWQRALGAALFGT